MSINRRGNVVAKDGRTGKAVDRQQMKSWKDAEKSMLAHSHDGDGRRTKPADKGPPSVEEFHKKYNEGRERPSGMKAKDQEPPQMPEDKRGKGYFNDVPTTGSRSWLRGGEYGGMSRPTYDHQPEHRHTLPRGNKASGQDETKSPFSAAYIKPNFKRS